MKPRCCWQQRCWTLLAPSQIAWREFDVRSTSMASAHNKLGIGCNHSISLENAHLKRNKQWNMGLVYIDHHLIGLYRCILISNRMRAFLPAVLAARQNWRLFRPKTKLLKSVWKHLVKKSLDKEPGIQNCFFDWPFLTKKITFGRADNYWSKTCFACV